ncbi:MAG: sugar phosphate nucleotidyltransferase, partial [Candidatus Neomarinimicrobiota bacterium]
MKAIIPIAGKGTRLLPHTRTLQKALLPVAGKPVLEHILAPLIEAGISHITFVVGHLGDQISEFMSNYNGLPVTFVEQIRPKGLGDAVNLGLEPVDEPVVIVLADTIMELNYKEFLEGKSNVIGVVEVENPEDFGIVETVGRRVVDVVEKPEEPVSNLAIAGIYRLSSQLQLKHALDTLKKNHTMTKGEYQLTDALELMLDDGATIRAETLDRWLDCGTKETLLSTNRYLLQQQPGGIFVHPEAALEGSTVRSTSVMEGCMLIDTIT